MEATLSFAPGRSTFGADPLSAYNSLPSPGLSQDTPSTQNTAPAPAMLCSLFMICRLFCSAPVDVLVILFYSFFHVYFLSCLFFLLSSSSPGPSFSRFQCPVVFLLRLTDPILPFLFLTHTPIFSFQHLCLSFFLSFCSFPLRLFPLSSFFSLPPF